MITDTTPKEAKFYVYELRDEQNQTFYVGAGTSDRLNHHRRPSVWKRGGKLYKKIQEMHADGSIFTSHKIAFFEDLPDAHAKEKELISFYGKEQLCNVTDGGYGTRGRPITDAMRQKFSRPWQQSEKDAQSLRRRGKSLTLEHRKKISESKKGHSVSEETKLKIRASNVGLKRSEETRQRMREASARRKSLKGSFLSAAL